MYALRLIQLFRFVSGFLEEQKLFNRRFIDPFLNGFYMQYNTRLGKDTVERIKNYYCLGIPLTCAAYARIYGRDLSDKERENAVLAGIITPLMDDFTDKKQMSPEALDELISFTNQHRPAALNEAIVKHILNILIGRVTSADDILFSFRKTVEAQHWSEKQLQPGTPDEEILAVTLEKGSWSYLLLHYLIEEVPSDQAVEVIRQMGGTLQLCNDIFDVHKDFLEGVKTIPNSCADYREFEKYYRSECVKFCVMAHSLPYKTADVGAFVSLICLVMARGIVALRMLSRLQKKLGGGPLPLEKLERKQLICDMEKPLNYLKTAWYARSIERMSKRRPS